MLCLSKNTYDLRYVCQTTNLFTLHGRPVLPLQIFCKPYKALLTPLLQTIVRSSADVIGG